MPRSGRLRRGSDTRAGATVPGLAPSMASMSAQCHPDSRPWSRRWRACGAALVLGIVATAIATTVAAADQAPGARRAEPVAVVAARARIDLRTLDPARANASARPRPVPEAESPLRAELALTPPRPPRAARAKPGPARKSAAGRAPAPVLAFEPLGGGDGGWINDTHGAIGRTQVFSALNPGYRVHDRHGALLAAWSPSAFWGGVVDASAIVFDPQAMYDAAAGRFVTVAVGYRVNGEGDALLLAVSDGDDARAGWTQYRIVVQPEARWKVDRPTLGASDALLGVTLMLYSPADPALIPESGSRLYALRKQELYATPATLPVRVFQLGIGPLPYPTVAVHDPDAPPERRLAVLGQPDNDVMTVAVLDDVGGELVYAPASTRIAAPGLVLYANKPTRTFQRDSSVRPICAGVQAGTVHRGRLYFAHQMAIDIGPHLVPSLRWGVIDLDTRELLASELIEAAVHDVSYQCPSIAGDASRVVIGFVRTSPKEYVGAGYVIHRSGVTSAARLYRPGIAPFTRTWSDDYGRIGDYSVTTFDPANRCLAWTAQEYAAGADNVVPVWAAVPLCVK